MQLKKTDGTEIFGAVVSDVIEFTLALGAQAYPNLPIEERMRILLPPRQLPSIEIARRMELDRLASGN